MNPGVKGRSLATAFDTDEYNVMLVANKFQTGFDQPLLVAMYVDKKLSGVTTVQTLSRLNRTFPGKDNTYILDFVNNPDDILAAFLPYYQRATLAGPSDPNVIHDLRAKLDAAQIYLDSEVDGFAAAYVHGEGNNALTKWITPARSRFFAQLQQAADAGTPPGSKHSSCSAPTWRPTSGRTTSCRRSSITATRIWRSGPCSTGCSSG